MRKLFQKRACSLTLVLAMLLGMLGHGTLMPKAAAATYTGTEYTIYTDADGVWLNDGTNAVNNTDGIIEFNSTVPITLTVQGEVNIKHLRSYNASLTIKGDVNASLTIDSEGLDRHALLVSVGELTLDNVSVTIKNATQNGIRVPGVGGNIILQNKAYLSVSNKGSTANDFGVQSVNGNIEVSGGSTLEATNCYSHGVYAEQGDIIVDGGRIIAVNNGGGSDDNSHGTGILASDGKIAVTSGGSIEATENLFRGVFSGGTEGISVTGDGSSITANGNHHTGIYANAGSIVVKDGATVKAVYNESSGILAHNELSITDATVAVLKSENYYGMGSRGDNGFVSIKNSTIYASDNNTHGIYSASGDISISNSTIEANQNNTHGIIAENGGITISDDSTVTANKNQTTNVSATKDIVVKGGSTLTAGTADPALKHTSVQAGGQLQVTGATLNAAAWYRAVIAGGISLDDNATLKATAVSIAAGDTKSASAYAETIKVQGGSTLTEVYTSPIFLHDQVIVNPYKKGSNIASLASYTWEPSALISLTSDESGFLTAAHEEGVTMTGTRKNDNAADNSNEVVALTTGGTHIVQFTANLGFSGFTVTYDGNGATGGSVPIDDNEYAYNAEAIVLGNTGKLIRSGYTFNGWSAKIDGKTEVYQEGDAVPMVQDVVFHASWQKNSGSSSGSSSSSNSGNTGESNSDDNNDTIQVPYFHNTAYIRGYEDDTVRPDVAITRAEVAQILYNISGMSANSVSNFSDVDTDAWYHAAISGMTDSSIISGYSDNTFRPSENITRAEFAALVVRYAGLSPMTETTSFSDVPQDHWASGYIAAAQAAGYMSGYEDGSFKPEQSITRAQAVTGINHLLGILCDANSIAAVSQDIKIYRDNANSAAWYYYEILAASNSFSYTKEADGRQVWVHINN